MAEIIYNNDVPAELRDAVQPHLDKWAWLIPTWCHRVRVGNTLDGSEGMTADNQTQPEYRAAYIRFSPLWLELDDGRREETAIHELLHIPIEPMRQVLTDLLRTSTNEPLVDLVAEQWRLAFEGTVQDLTYAIQKRVA